MHWTKLNIKVFFSKWHKSISSQICSHWTNSKWLYQSQKIKMCSSTKEDLLYDLLPALLARLSWGEGLVTPGQFSKVNTQILTAYTRSPTKRYWKRANDLKLQKSNLTCWNETVLLKLSYFSLTSIEQFYVNHIESHILCWKALGSKDKKWIRMCPPKY